MKDFIKNKNINIRKLSYVFMFSFMFLYINSIGLIMDIHNGLDLKYMVSYFFVCILLALVISIFCYNIKFSKINNNYVIVKYKKYRFLIISAIIFISFIPALLAYYPSIFSYDVESQVQQIMNHQYTRFHPVIHTFLIEICLRLGQVIFSSSTGGVLIYSIIQMIILSVCLSFGINYLFKLKVNKKIILFLLIYIIIMPYNSIMSISSTKDVIFSGLTLLLFCIISQKIDNDDKNKWINIVIVFIMWFSFRNNAFFAFILCSFIILIFCKKRIIILLLIICICVCNSGFNIVLDYIFKLESISTEEIISVPGSQIARAAIVYENTLDEQDQIAINDLFEESYHYYNPYLFDDIKTKFVFGIADIPTLLKIWFRLLPISLDSYVEAFIELNRGSWYIFDISYTTVYAHKYYDLVEDYNSLQKKNIGYIETQSRNILNIEYKTINEKFKNYYESICTDNVLHDNLISKIILSPSLSLWIIIFCLFYNLYKKKYNDNIPIILLLSYWITVLLGPCTLFRYMYPLVITSPFCLIKTLFKN